VPTHDAEASLRAEDPFTRSADVRAFAARPPVDSHEASVENADAATAAEYVRKTFNDEPLVANEVPGDSSYASLAAGDVSRFSEEASANSAEACIAAEEVSVRAEEARVIPDDA
jgi:hypothetical protein